MHGTSKTGLSRQGFGTEQPSLCPGTFSETESNLEKLASFSQEKNDSHTTCTMPATGAVDRGKAVGPHVVPQQYAVAEHESEPLVTGTIYPSSFGLSSLLTSAGLALPWVAFITWPTKKPSNLSFPLRYCSS